MKFCAKCGVQNNDNDAFCYSCGTLFEEQNQAQPQQQQEQQQQQVWQQQPQQAWQQPQQQPVYQQQAYQQPGMQPAKPSAGMAIASMVLGICALLFSCCIPYLPFFLAVVAVILGGLSLAKKQGGKGMAIAGLVCGIIALIPSLMVLIGGAALTSALSDLSDMSYYM